MNELQAEHLRDFVKAMMEKGFVDDVHFESIQEMENGTIVVHVSQYFHFFPDEGNRVADKQSSEVKQ